MFKNLLKPWPTHRCRFETIRSILRFVFGTHAETNVLLLPTDLPRVLARVIDSDVDTDNRTCAMVCLYNIAVNQSAKFGSTLMNKAVGFLQNASGSAAGACILRLMGAQTALLPISSLPDDELHTSNIALMFLINIMGNQEAHSKGQDSPIMLIRPDFVSVGDAARAC